MSKFDPRIYLFSLGHFSVDWAQGAIPALLPWFISNCGLNYQAAGTIIFANILLSSVLQPVFGYYADRVSKPWFAPAGSIIGGLSIAALPFVENYAAILALSMLSGLGAAIYHPEAARMVNALAGASKGRAMGTFSVGGNAGFAAGPAFAGLCAYVLDPRLLVAYGAVNLVIALLLHRVLPKAMRDIRCGTLEAAARNGGAPLPAQNDWRSFGRLSVVIFARSITFSSCMAFIPLYWVSVLGAHAQTASLSLTAFSVMGAVFTYFGGLLCDRLGFVKTMRVCFTLLIPALALLVNAWSLPAAALALIPAAFCVFSPYSATVVLGQTYLGKNIAFASGVTLGLTTTVGGLFAPLIGRAADSFGVHAALQCLWAVAIIAAAASFTLKTPKALEKKPRG
jgi:FSR family fosmidomycin resistance protein-like MFS transporter